ncbi:MAG: DUF1320 family protein [Candidatus Lernaella stagnicola]|nr:DUF1320 family protein [Candidatus Lernaella stagnicola]
MASLTSDEFRERCVAADLDATLGDLDDDDQDTWIEQAIASADADLEGYAAGRYPTPLTATEQVKGLAHQLAWFTLCRRKNWNYGEQEREDEKQLRRKLERISERKFILTGQGANKTADEMTSIRETDPSARTTGRARKLTRDTMEGM